MFTPGENWCSREAKKRKIRQAEVETTSDTNACANSDKISEAYYLMGSYRFNHWFSLGSTYSDFYRDIDLRDSDGERQNPVIG